MNTSDVSLDRLHDIIVPPPVPWWPPAPGWYLVIGFAFLLLVAALSRGLIRWQYNCYRREALTQLAQMEALLRNPAERADALLSLAELLKRTALTAFGRRAVASLTGSSWFAFLDGTARGSNFGVTLGTRWENAIYDPPTADALDQKTLDELTAAIRGWIRDHRVIAQPAHRDTKGDPTADTASLASV